MCSPFICGSFHLEEEEEDMEPYSPCSTPRRSSRKGGSCKSKDSKNPYANRGLDKFSALLADLEDKRQKIYTRMGSDDISFVRFVYSNSNDIKPIVVKLRERKQHKTNVEDVKDNKPMSAHTRSEAEPSTAVDEVLVQQRRVQSDDQKTTKKKSFMITWNLKFDHWRRPSYYLPVIIILILFFLAVYGRSFAILCTSLGWYLVPSYTTKGGGSLYSKGPKKKKAYVRGFSENKMVSGGLSSPTSVITGPTDKSPRRQHGHRGSW